MLRQLQAAAEENQCVEFYESIKIVYKKLQ